MPLPGLLLLAKKKAPEMDDSEDMPSEDDGPSQDEALHVVMKSFLQSVKDEDVEEACKSFKDLLDLADQDDGGKEEE